MGKCAPAVSIFGCTFSFRHWVNLSADPRFKTAEWSYAESAVGNVQLSFGNDEVRKTRWIAADVGATCCSDDGKRRQVQGEGRESSLQIISPSTSPVASQYHSCIIARSFSASSVSDKE